MAQRASLATRERLILGVLLIVQFMLILDVAIVSVAVPSMQESLGIRAGDLQWVSTAYTLTFGGLLVAAGRIADLFGRRRMFIIGTAVFTVSSLLCGAVQESWQLFAARGAQGVGAALVSPAILSLLLTSFADESKRNRVLGLWGAVGSGGAIAGQLIGGVITDSLGWRWVFLVNLPIGIIACLVAPLLLARDGERSGDRLDTTGAVTLTLGLLFAVFGVSRIADHGADTVVFGVFVVAAILLAVFARHERRYPDPLVPFDIFDNRSLVGGNLLSIVNGVMVMTAIFFSTLYMQHVLNFSALQAGLAFAPVTVVILIISGMTGRLTDRFGIRALLVTGAIFTGLGILGLMAMRVGGDYWLTVLPGLLLLGIGQGLAFAPATSAATHGVPDDRQGLAGGLVTMSQQLGGAVGFAVLATIAAAVLPDPTTSDPYALIDGYRLGYLVGLVLPVLGVIFALWLTPGRTAPAASADQPATANT
ncbi:putative MFS transporter [Actinoplanes missouriensis 431]|uniref:Putative MFS transporter n=1 Tax=Actinoplanes missouriensis (strain ATCC 14538 / DSM 43046 / CBS 188.64 / JCM 3121 / NBRC 102363 / NCIMB 12654 / NRRL B-3342 / UNCC 431) TaxID=512565 RepID=I0H611_ACTM4|nr:MFS transporter [Actinoplanes missouriensis]BAL88448.1 putative MFS transporter [Actinoplanes missouriensis 431]